MTARASSHRPEFHRRAPVKEPCRVATTGNITIATALNDGDSLDGVTLVAGYRVLVWQQTDASENGIYIVGASPARAYDLVASDALPGFLVLVLAGSTYASTLFMNTNVNAIVVDTDDITFEFAIADAPNAELNIEGGQSVISAHGNMGATETFDPTAGNVHTGTLNANCTVTLSAPVGSGAATLELWITGDGTSEMVWPGSVTVLGTFAVIPAAETTRYILESIDGGTSWIAVEVGASSGSSGRWELAVIPGSPPDSLYADGDWLYIEVPV